MAVGGVDVLALFFKMIRLKSKMLNCMLHLACLSIACICRSEVHTQKQETPYKIHFQFMLHLSRQASMALPDQKNSYLELFG